MWKFSPATEGCEPAGSYSITSTCRSMPVAGMHSSRSLDGGVLGRVPLYDTQCAKSDVSGVRTNATPQMTR